jgi:hypothetical protein
MVLHHFAQSDCNQATWIPSTLYAYCYRGHYLTLPSLAISIDYGTWSGGCRGCESLWIGLSCPRISYTGDEWLACPRLEIHGRTVPMDVSKITGSSSHATPAIAHHTSAEASERTNAFSVTMVQKEKIYPENSEHYIRQASQIAVRQLVRPFSKSATIVASDHSKGTLVDSFLWKLARLPEYLPRTVWSENSYTVEDTSHTLGTCIHGHLQCSLLLFLSSGIWLLTLLCTKFQCQSMEASLKHFGSSLFDKSEATVFCEASQNPRVWLNRPA